MRHDHVHTLSDMQKRFRTIEADLTDQGIKFYPPTTAGERARTLWRHVKQRLLRGAAVEITVSSLKLDLHREELRRARTILTDMELIKPRADGRYVLGRLGPFSKIDELIRDEYLDLKLAEEVVVALSAIMRKSKTHERPRPSSASQNWALGKRPRGHVAATPHNHLATTPKALPVSALKGKADLLGERTSFRF